MNYLKMKPVAAAFAFARDATVSLLIGVRSSRNG